MTETLSIEAAESDLKQIWGRIYGLLYGRIGSSTFETWCRSLDFHSRQGATVYLSVPTRSLRHWIAGHYVSDLLDLWKEYGIEKVEIVLRGVERAPPAPQIEKPRRVPRRGVMSRVALEDPPSEREDTEVRARKPARTIANRDLPKLPLLPSLAAEEIAGLRQRYPERFTIDNVANKVAAAFKTTELDMIHRNEQIMLLALRITMLIAVELLGMDKRDVADALRINYMRVASGLSHLERQITANPPLQDVIDRLKVFILRG